MTDNSKKRRGRSTGAAVAAVAAAVTAMLSGCASTTSAAPPPATVTLVPTPGSAVPSIQLTQLGEERIGLETIPVTVGQGGEATFPYAALLYEPNGQAAVYVDSGPFTFTRHFVSIASITATTVTVKSGVMPGDRVVTAGAEELLGVQNGVGEET